MAKSLWKPQRIQIYSFTTQILNVISILYLLNFKSHSSKLILLLFLSSSSSSLFLLFLFLLRLVLLILFFIDQCYINYLASVITLNLDNFLTAGIKAIPTDPPSITPTLVARFTGPHHRIILRCLVTMAARLVLLWCIRWRIIRSST